MSLRVAFDIDGVLADFRTAFQQAAQEAGGSNRTAEAESPSSDPLSSRDIKTTVFRLARWRNANDPYGTGQEPIPERIITRPPKAFVPEFGAAPIYLHYPIVLISP